MAQLGLKSIRRLISSRTREEDYVFGDTGSLNSLIETGGDPKPTKKLTPHPIEIRHSIDAYRPRHLLPSPPFSSKSSLCSCDYHSAVDYQVSPPYSAANSPPLCPSPAIGSPPRCAPKSKEDGCASNDMAPPVHNIVMNENLLLARKGCAAATPLKPLPQDPVDLVPLACLGNVRETDETLPREARLFDPRPKGLGHGRTISAGPVASAPIVSTSPHRSNYAVKLASLAAKSPSPKPARPSRKRARSAITRPSLRGLSEKAKDLFQRVEVDEVLSPEKLEQIRSSSRAQHHVSLRKSNETAATKRSGATLGSASRLSAESVSARTSTDTNTSRSDESETPFLTQDLVGKISQAGILGNAEQETPRATRFNPNQLRPMTPSPSQSGETASSANAPVGMKQLQPPPSSISALKSRSMSPQMKSRSVLSAKPTSPAATEAKSLKATMSDKHIFLPGTELTMTAPGIRHGRIRLAKADLVNGVGGQALDQAVHNPDDMTLDWTAFHMAILGGTGELFGEVTDYGHLQDLDEIEELCTWFDSLGLSGSGALIDAHDDFEMRRRDMQPWPLKVAPTREGRASPQHYEVGTHIAALATGSTVCSSLRSRDMAHAPPSGSLPIGRGNPSPVTTNRRRLATSKHACGADSVFGTAAASGSNRSSGGSSNNKNALMVDVARANGATNHNKGEDEQRKPNVENTQSLPQSPMLDLVVSRDVKNQEYVVPMGFNLSHDLSDYLNWNVLNMGLGEGSQCGPG